jgi:hypothetical protein
MGPRGEIVEASRGRPPPKAASTSGRSRLGQAATVSGPAVSVILPTHNRYETLPRAIRSVLSQTHQSLELIIVDDASTDDTKELVESVADPRNSYVRRDTRGGPGAARNTGIRAARADILAFQDSDDEWTPNKLEMQLSIFERSPAVGVVFCAWQKLEDGRLLQSYRPDDRMRSPDWSWDAAYDAPFTTPTIAVRRRVLEEVGMFDEKLPNREDWDLVFKLHGRCGFEAVDEFLVVKHETPGSHDSDRGTLLRSFETILARHGRQWISHPAILARHWQRICDLRLDVGDASGARAALWRARALRRVPPSKILRPLIRRLGMVGE